MNIGGVNEAEWHDRQDEGWVRLNGPSQQPKRSPRAIVEESIYGLLDCEHFLQGLQHLGHGRRRKLSKPLCQSSGINRSNLVHGDEATAFLEPTRHPPRIGAPAGGHRGYDHRAQVLIELVGRENQTWARLANLTAGRWIETHEVHVTAAADYHSHSLQSKPLDCGGSRG